MEFAPLVDFSAYQEERRMACLAGRNRLRAGGRKGFSGIPLMFPSTDAREILTEKARSREILAYSQKHDDQETRTVAVFIS